MFRSSLVLYVLFTMMTVVDANAQKVGGFVQVESVGDTKAGVVPTFDTLVSLKFDHGLSANGFLLVTEGWAEGYFGPSWAPAEWTEIALSVGGQQVEGKLDWRYATSLWLGYGIYSFFGIVEFDNTTFQGEKTGVWYDLKATAQALDWLSVGVEGRRFVGIGPRIDIKIPQIPLSVWCTWAPFEPEKLDGQLGHLTRFMFGALASF